MRTTAVVPVLVLAWGLTLAGTVTEAQNVEAFSIVSDSVGPLATDGRNRLQWVTPATAAPTDTLIIRYNTRAAADPCQLTDYPSLPTGGTEATTPLPAAPDSTQSFAHNGLNLGEWYCYSIWVFDGVATYDGPETAKGRPFDSGGAVRWKYNTGTATLAAPTVGWHGVLVPSNDTYVHAMERDTALSDDRGAWPAGYRPRPLNGVVQHRVPIVPLGGVWKAFLSTQTGWVYAVDTSDGSVLWSTPLPEGAAQGAPAGIFSAFGGDYDYILVGTSTGGGGNHLYALHPDSGAVIDSYPQPGEPGEFATGSIFGMPSVDYTSSQVCFGSLADGPSMWCLVLGPSIDALQPGWVAGFNDFPGSVVLFNGRVVAATVADEVYSFDALNGDSNFYSNDQIGGSAKGFLFPDRRGQDLYVAAENGANDRIWAFTDNGIDALSLKWSSPDPPFNNPSVLLYHPGTDDIYFGVEDYDDPSEVYPLDPITPAIVRIRTADGVVMGFVDLEVGDLANVVGPPSLDLGYGGMLYAGSSAGIVYAVSLSGF